MKTCVSNAPKLSDFFKSQVKDSLIVQSFMECHAVGKIGGSGKSSSSGISGRGASGGTGMGSGTVFAGMEGLKSGSGLFVESLCTSSPVSEKSIKFNFICLTRSAIVHAHLQANEPSTSGASPMKGRIAPDSYQSAGGRDETGKFTSWKSQAVKTGSQQARIASDRRPGGVLGDGSFLLVGLKLFHKLRGNFPSMRGNLPGQVKQKVSAAEKS